MSIATAIQNAQQKVANAYTAVSGKGGTLPSTQNLSNLPTAINSIPTGSSPVISSLNVTPSTSAQTITAPSGTDGYSPVNVSAVTSAIDQNISAGNIKSGVSILGVTGTYSGGGSKYGCTIDSILGNVDANGVLQEASADANLVFNGVEDIAASALAYRFYLNTKVKTVSFPDLTQLTKNNQSMRNTFYNCTELISVNLSNLETISGGSAMQSTFQYCTKLPTVDLSSLTTVSGSSSMSYAFSYCTSLVSVDLSGLTTVSGGSAMSYAFQSCTNLTTIDLSSLTTVSGSSAMNNTFNGCTSLVSVDLSGLTTISGGSAMSNAFQGCTKLETISFSSLETIGTNTSSTNYSQFSQAFRNCTLLTSITFPELTAIYCTGGNSASYGTFYYNDKIQKMYFPKLTTITYGTGASTTNQNACKNIFNSCTSLTEIHFGATNRTAIEASPGYSTIWGRGAGNATIYFDL